MWHLAKFLRATAMLSVYVGLLTSSTRVRADTISINLYNESAADPTVHQLVAGEVAGIVPAANWNNLPFVGGTNDHSTALIPLNNASGAMAANFQSTLTTGYVGNFDDVVASTAPTSANRKFMQSYLSFDNDPNDSPFDEGSLIISGLGSPFTTSTYNMIVYFDADRNDRRHTVTVNGTDVIGDDDSTWDGTFRKAVGPGVSANYAVFEGLSANTVTINMASSSGRAAVNAIQITTDAIPTPHPVLSINRDTGAITLINGTASDIPLAAYLIRSAAGSLDQTHWRSIADNYDVSGNGSIDASDNWFKFTTPGTFDNLGEGALTSGNISAGQNVILGEAGTWIASPTEDITADLLLADGSHLPTVIEFVGNGGSSFSTADINTDGSVDAADWLILRGNMYNPSAPSDLTAAQSFGIGDINSDGGVDREDFLAFKSAYDAINGAGSFAAMTSVPEPGTYLLAGVPLFAFALRRRFHTSIMCLATCSAMLIATTACAQQSISINLWNADAGSVENNTVVAGRTAGLVPVDGQFWNNLSFPGGVVDAQLTSPLMDSTGNANAATFTSTLQSAFVGFSGAAGAAPDTGDRAMMASYLSYDIAGEGTAPDDLGNLTISGLGNAFTGPGYDVYIYSDADANNRLFSITIGGETLTINDNQTYDGTFNEGGSGSNENFAIFRGLNGGSFSIEMDSSAGRGAVNGIQIVVRDNLPDFLELSVNRATGEVTLQNRTGAGVAIDYYEIRSASGALVAGGAGAPDGDYNANGVVDAADYTIWKDSFGQTGAGLAADGNGNNVIDAADYTIWKDNFGATGGGGDGGWNSLEDQDFEGSGPAGDGLGWEEGDAVSNNLLFEAYLSGNSTIGDGATISLGDAFAAGSTEDLIFEYHVVGAGNRFESGIVSYAAGSTSSAAPVPEPGGLLLLGLGSILVLWKISR